MRFIFYLFTKLKYLFILSKKWVNFKMLIIQLNLRYCGPLNVDVTVNGERFFLFNGGDLLSEEKRYVK